MIANAKNRNVKLSRFSGDRMAKGPRNARSSRSKDATR
jgi:hypothetical protein